MSNRKGKEGTKGFGGGLAALSRARRGEASALESVEVADEEAEALYDEVDEEEYQRKVAERRGRQGVVVADSEDEDLGYSDDGEEEWWSDEADLKPSSSSTATRGSLLGERPRRARRAAAPRKPRGEGGQRIQKMFRQGAHPHEQSLHPQQASLSQALPDDADLQHLIDDLISNPLDEHDPLAFTSTQTQPQASAHSVQVRKTPIKKDVQHVPFIKTEPPSKPSLKIDHPQYQPPLKSESPSSCQPSSFSSLSSFSSVSTQATQSLVDDSQSYLQDDPSEDAYFLEALEAAAPQPQQPTVAYVPPQEEPSQVPEAERLFTRRSNISASTSSHPTAMSAVEGQELPPSAQGQERLAFYWLDMCELAAQPGAVFLFGKVSVAHPKGPLLPPSLRYQSCCLTVRNVERVLFFVPRPERLDGGGAIADLEACMDEVEALLLEHGVRSGFRLKPVTRNYAFDAEGVPKGRLQVLKLKYPYAAPALPAELRGDSAFCHVFGAQTRASEHLILKRKLMGPGWLHVPTALLQGPQGAGRSSWCAYEFAVSDPKALDSGELHSKALEVPPLRVMAVQFKTVMNAKLKSHELAAVSLVVHSNVSSESPTPNPRAHFQRLTLLRKMDLGRGVFPRSFALAVQSRPDLQQSVRLCDSEQALLAEFLAEVLKIDPDVYIGHNFLNWTLDVLLTRLKKASTTFVRTWSCIGRLRRSNMPHLSSSARDGASKTSSFGARDALSGRLVCDTYLASKDLLLGTQKTYALGELARTQLGLNREELEQEELFACYSTDQGLRKVVGHTVWDAELSLLLQFRINILPLTKALCTLSGHLWSHSLLGARAERIEYLLLHEFQKRKYIVPDRAKAKASAAGPRRRAKAAYAGGLVLAPKAGLYNSYTLLLDFASLYPSIIMEHNICWTTVVRTRRSPQQTPDQQQQPAPKAQGMAEWEPTEPPPSHLEPGVLPSVIKTLVDRRRAVKRLLASAEGEERAQLDTRQMALKLLANSMYGCLGFGFSRFFAMPLADLITRLGRETLQRTVDVATNQFALNVIYGDTDSIMISTGLYEKEPVLDLGRKVLKAINQEYKCLELEMDGIFKTLLLLKKKKYAALTESLGPDSKVEKQVKGLDVVRRDWAVVATNIGNQVLNLILEGRATDEVAPAIHEFLRKMAEQIRSGQMSPHLFAITKALKRDPTEYADASVQPHVQVALRMRQRNEPVFVGDHISYVIGRKSHPESGEADPAASSSSSIAQRAYNLKEITTSQGQLQVDYEYYLSNQVHPLVSRLCAYIDGTDAAQLAIQLGMDASRYQSAANRSQASGSSSRTDMILDIDQRHWLRSGTPLAIRCHLCQHTSEMDGLFSLVRTINDDYEVHASNNLAASPQLTPSAQSILQSLRTCYSCKRTFSPAKMLNSLRLRVRELIDELYDHRLVCDSEHGQHETHELFFSESRHPRCVYRECGRRVSLEVPPRKVYEQLMYLRNAFDCEEALNNIKNQSVTQQVKAYLMQTNLLETYRHLFQFVTGTLDVSAFANLDGRETFFGL